MTPRTTYQGTNPHVAQRTSLVALGKSLWRNRRLIAKMTRREVMGRYKGSVIGLAWILASLGVFLRDVGQTIGIFTYGYAVSFPRLLPSDCPTGRVPPLAHG